MSTKIAPLTQKQQEFWNYIDRKISENGVIPSYSVIAKHFGISSAAVANYISILKKRRRLVIHDVYGAVSLGKTRQLMLKNKSTITMQLVPFLHKVPEDYSMRAPGNGVFRLLNGCFSSFDLKSGDIIEAAPLGKDSLRTGDLAVVRYLDFFCLKFYIGQKTDMLSKDMLPATCIYDTAPSHGFIAGKVVNICRRIVSA